MLLSISVIETACIENGQDCWCLRFRNAVCLLKEVNINYMGERLVFTKHVEQVNLVLCHNSGFAKVHNIFD